MVVFTCNYCGESLQKPKVEKHYQFVCRNREKNVTCVDCFKDFRADEYVTHTKCFTEEERYAARGTHSTSIVKKGEVKQELWVNQVKSILDREQNLRPSQKKLLNTISGYHNIPRKKQKFMNFLKNCMSGKVNMIDVEEIWNIIEKHTKTNLNSVDNIQNIDSGNGFNNSEDKMENSNNKADLKNNPQGIEDQQNIISNNKNGDVTVTVVSKRKSHELNLSSDVIEQSKLKKKKLDHEDLSDENNSDIKQNRFSITKAVMDILRKKGEISLRKLKRKIFAQYRVHTDDCVNEEMLYAKIEKKLDKMPNVTITEPVVKLLQDN